MAGVMCVWANLSEEAMDWYEDDYLPKMTSLHSTSTLHCEVTETGLEQEPIGHLDAPWELMSVYECEDIAKTTAAVHDKSNHPPEQEFLKNARFDVRTYREIRRWGGEGWDGDMTQVVSVSAMEWRFPAQHEKPIMKFYLDYMAPAIASSEDVLRYRLFSVEEATVFTEGTLVGKDKDSVHTYFILVEFASEDWPWDKVMELSQHEDWIKYFESQVVKWNTSHYLVQRLYPEDQPGSLEAAEDDEDS